MEIENYCIMENDICLEVKYNGYYFHLEQTAMNHAFSFVPSMMRNSVVESIKGNDKDFWNAYVEILNKFDDERLLSLYYKLFNMSVFLGYQSGLEFSYKDFDNEDILGWLEDDMIPKNLKYSVLKKAEWVYLLGNKGEGIYKIGMTTRTPSKRTNEFSPKLPFETEIMAKCPTGNAIKLERQLHAKFGTKRKKGEWFELSDGDVVYIRSMSI